MKHAHADDFVSIVNLQNGWLLLENQHQEDGKLFSTYQYGRWIEGWLIDVHGWVKDCSSYVSLTSAKEALIEQLYLEGKIDRSLPAALHHWARCFREGILNDEHSDRIASILEHAAYDVQFDRQLDSSYNKGDTVC